LHQSRKTESKTKRKKDKTPTAEVSFKLYKGGKSIAEIAEERGFVPSTIEGHLCQYIESGDVDAYSIVEMEKLDNMLKLITDETTSSSEVKAKLGDEYTYTDVKVAMSHYRFLSKPK